MIENRRDLGGTEGAIALCQQAVALSFAVLPCNAHCAVIVTGLKAIALPPAAGEPRQRLEHDDQ
jgi:hypothetical protein